jgi:hypothetical protein
MTPEVLIRYVADFDSGRPAVVISGQEPTWNRELFHAIRGLREGRRPEVRAHELPGFAAFDGAQISLHAAVSGCGLVRASPHQPFQWQRTKEGWSQVEDLLSGACSRDLCEPRLFELESQGETRVIFDGRSETADRSDVPPPGGRETSIQGYVGHRHCQRHPLVEAASLCHRCATALCHACAQVASGRSVCAAGCEPQGRLRFHPDADPEYGSLLLIDAEVVATRELFHAIRSLRLGQRNLVIAHELPGFSSTPQVQLLLSRSALDEGVTNQPAAAAFRWALTSPGWERVEDTLALACDRYWDSSGSLDLQETGQVRVILGRDW